MLTETFIVAPEIGLERERTLWQAGFRTWWDVHGAADSDLPTGVPVPFLRHTVEACIHAFERRNWAAVAQVLKAGSQWRCLQLVSADSPLSGSAPPLRILALDIETEGISKWENRVTTVGICGDATEHKPIALLPHEPGFKEQLFHVLKQTDLLLTFNGTQFDIPFLKAQPDLVEMPVPPFHVDLRFAFSAVGIKGGLKRVQVQMGYQREGALAEVDGFMAVLLWQEHLRNTPGALETLVRYCLEDVVVLLDLAPLVYDMLAKSLGRAWSALRRPSVGLHHLPFDPNLITRLQRCTSVRNSYPRRSPQRW